MMLLPSVQLDSLVEDTSAVFVANRNPQPGEVQVPVSAAIEFDYYGSLVDLRIRINDVLVVSMIDPGGPVFGDWTMDSQPTPDGVGTRIRILHPALEFEPSQKIVVRVTSGSSVAFWHFIAFDTNPPLIESVRAVNKDQLRVVFTEPVYMGAVETGDALNPASYTIDNVSKPAATPAVLHVDYVSPTEVMLTTEFELSFGARYMLVVSGVSDEFGNVFLPPNNVSGFNGFLPSFPDGRRWVLHDFVPRIALSLDTSRDLVMFLGSLQDTSNLLLHMIDRWIEIIDPDTAPESFVDAMLLDLGNPFTFELTVSQKRKLVKLLVAIYKLKGTAKGIIDVVRFFCGIEVTVETFVGLGWIIGYHQLSTTGQDAPNPAIIGPGRRAIYSFRVLHTGFLTPKQREYITAIAIYMKGAPEHFVGLRDSSYQPLDEGYWIVEVTRTGYARIWHNTGPTLPPVSGKAISSFTLEEPFA
jgi:phage tail-like protein